MRVRDRLLLASLTAVTWVLRWLPAFLTYGGMTALAWLATPFVVARDRKAGPRRTSIRRNLQIAFGPELPDAEIRRITFGVVRHILSLIVDYSRWPRFDARPLEEILSPEDQETCKAVYKEGKGAIFLTGHLGFFELCCSISQRLDVPMNTVVNPIGRGAFNRFMTNMRERSGQRIIDNRGALLTMKRVLEDGGVLGVAIDENSKHRPMFLPFFGTLAATRPYLASIQRMTGATIVFCAAYRTGPGRHKVHVVDTIRAIKTEDREADERAVMLRVNRAAEASIRACPEQWLWNSRRWKTRPKDEILDDQGLPPRVQPPIPIDPGLRFQPRLPETAEE